MNDDVEVTWDPDTYPAEIRAEVHDYEVLQEMVVRATTGVAVCSILELGIGSGETAKGLLHSHPQARLVGIDSSPEMLKGAAERLPADRVTFVEQDLGAPLPDERFDLVVSALAIHHLWGERKAALFKRVADALGPGGRFVIGDVVIPADPSDALVEIEPGYDFPSSLEDQSRWLDEAGFVTHVTWVCKDLAVLKSELRL